MAFAPKVKLSNGTEMPILALGTWDARDREIYDAVKVAIDVGYRHFDTAWLYQNEKEVGEAIREKIAEGKIKREDVYVTTKLWPTSFPRDQVVPACKVSLANLGLDYIDQYLIHWPVGMQYTKKSANLLENLASTDDDYLEAYKGLEDCYQLGLVKSIGISNFNSEQVDRVLSMATIKPVVNQVECHVQLNQKKLIAFCKERNILITSYCPLGRPNPAAKTPAFLFSPEVANIAKKYGKTPAQITLRYLVSLILF